MGFSGVEEFAVRVDPEHEVGGKMGEFLDGVPPAGKALGQKGESFGGGRARD
jgi:hypothetical protein